MWNFKGYLWNSTQNVSPIHWKMWILFTGENLRALRFKSSQVFLKCPPWQTIEHMLLECTVLKLWWILHNWLIEDPCWDGSWDLHSGVSESSWILLSDMNGHISSTTSYSNQSPTEEILDLNSSLRLGNSFIKYKQSWKNTACEGLLICLEGHV